MTSADNYNEFLYLYIVERNADGVIDNMFRIVYWADEEDPDDISRGVYVLYGDRAPLKKSTFIPYRLQFSSRSDIIRFLRFTIGADSSVSVEMHHYFGWYDDSLDTYHIDWTACKASKDTEVVAYDTCADRYGLKTVETGLDIIRYAIRV
jgi:hypothetical protein